MLKIGLLGAGRIGALHAANIASDTNSQLCAVCDIHAESAEKLAAAFDAKVKTSEAILCDPAIDAVLIATSTDTHSDLIEQATRSGKAVLCEKPIDLDLGRAQACVKAVGDAARTSVMIGFNRRFDPHFSALKDSVVHDEIGKPELLSLTSFDPAPPPISYITGSGGLFRDMMIHDFDMACFIMNALPIEVYATGSALVSDKIGAAGDIDTAAVTLRYADGGLAVIKNSRRAGYGYDQRIEILGSKGLLQAGNVIENTVIKSTKAGVTSARPVPFFLERYQTAYRAEWSAFVHAIMQKISPPVTLEDGLNALIIAEAATHSAQKGCPVLIRDIEDASHVT